MKIMTIASLLASAFFACKHAPTDNQSEAKMVNGTVMRDAQNPIAQSTVFLITGQNQVVCSGAYIYPGWVLSARHCLFDAEQHGGIQSVGRGLDSAYPTEEVAIVGQPIQHGQSDLVLFRLERPLKTATFRIGSVALQQPKDLIVAGYGITDTSETDINLKFPLQYGVVQFGNVEGNLINFGTPIGGTNPCSGDSGGPMLAEERDGSLLLIGIAASTHGGACLFGGYYTHLVGFYDWIAQSIGVPWSEIVQGSNNPGSNPDPIYNPDPVYNPGPGHNPGQGGGGFSCVVDLRGTWPAASLMDSPGRPWRALGEVLEGTTVQAVSRSSGDFLDSRDGTQRSDQWVLVKTQDGREGYVNSMYVSCPRGF